MCTGSSARFEARRRDLLMHSIELQGTGRFLGAKHPVFIAAEAGLNHNGQLALAHRLIDLASEAGADGIKFQNYRTEDFITDNTLTWRYENAGKTIEESQFAMFKRCEMRPEWLAELAGHASERGIVFFATPTNSLGVHELVEAGVPLIKNGSDFLQNLPLIRVMAQTGLPTVLSTGMATLAEIDDAVRAFREAGGASLVLLHCTSAYPAPPEHLHLRKIPALRDAFGCLVGFSDHSEGVTAASVAVALGACFIEKHFTYDNLAPGPDHRFSADPVELGDLVRTVRHAEAALGQSAMGPTEVERGVRWEARLSCAAARDLAAGEILRPDDIAFRRPGGGLPPSFASHLSKCRLRRAIPAGKLLDISDFQ